MPPTDKQRREAARRQLQKKLEQRQLDEARRRKTTLITSVVSTVAVIALVAILIVVLGGNDKKKPAASDSPSGSVTPSATSPAATSSVPSYPCTWTKGAASSRPVSKPSTTTPPKTGTAVVTVKTTQGQMTFTLDRAKAPCTVANFLSLVSQKYYNNTPCHRLNTSSIYVLQCGDPTGTGMGGPGYTIPDEFDPNGKYTTGTLAMAKTTAPNSGGSQFFIVYKDDPLPPQYTIFGKVTAGLDVVDKVAAKGTDNANSSGDGHPNLKITITSMTAAG